MHHCQRQILGAARLLHRLAAGGMLVMVGLALAGCAGGQQPFAKDVNALSAPQDAADWPRVTVVSFSGLPEGKDEQFLQALVAETFRRQIALVNASPDTGIYSLSGVVSAREVDGRTAVSWTWDVTGWNGGAGETTISGQEFVAQPKREAIPPPPDPADDSWGKVDGFMLRRVAMHMAESLSSYFGERGYLTQTAGLPPPVETFVRAGPGAEKDIDLSMLGPNELAMRRARGDITEEDLAAAGLPSLVTPPDSTAEMEPPPGQSRQDLANPSPAEQPNQASKPSQPGQKAISSVAVAAITGAPGDGNQALAAALRKILKSAGWPLQDKPSDETLVIRGQVGVAPPGGGAQQVTLEWTVTDPTGKVLGSVKQANQVPAGSLDGKWGLTADYAAEAASYGIFELVNKLR